MATVSPTRKTPPPEIAALSPPKSPPTKPSSIPHDADSSPAQADVNDKKSDVTDTFPEITWSNFWTELNWLHVIIFALTPILTVYGFCTTEVFWQTVVFSVIYYFVTGIGVTAGYHRLWSHRSYNATIPLQLFLAFAGAGAAQGSAKWWARGHRAHHRYTDTDLDPYGAHRGLFWCHIGWMMVIPRRKPGTVDASDLTNSAIVRWQHRHFRVLIPLMAVVFPTIVCGLGWNDWRGGFYYATVARLLFVHHGTFCINSLAHYLGEAPFDDKHSPRDHFITALLSWGEGYHNFHHQFPMDYRNAIKWYQYDPTKWFIVMCKWLGLASNLRQFPDNEVKKGQLTMKLKMLRESQDEIEWPTSSNGLPVISWESFQEQSKTRELVLVSGFIHDVSAFMDEHPGGRQLLAKNIGKDATAAFFGGVYEHSNAAHNLLAMMRVGILHGGLEIESEKVVPPSQRLRILKTEEIPVAMY